MTNKLNWKTWKKNGKMHFSGRGIHCLPGKREVKNIARTREVRAHQIRRIRSGI